MSWISGPSLIFHSHHILKTISGAYLISKTGSESKKTTGWTTLSFIITNKIRNPRSKTLYNSFISMVKKDTGSNPAHIKLYRIYFDCDNRFIYKKKIGNCFCGSLAKVLISYYKGCGFKPLVNRNKKL